MATCPQLNLLETTIQAGSPSIGPLLDLLNAPDWSQINSSFCPPSLGALTRAPARHRSERMNKQAPSAARILTMVAFAASCIGLLLFLWISFGGTTSLGPKGYEISAEFDQAENLGSQADVRISGVNVGKVVGVSLDRHTGLTRAVMEIDPQFAPRPADTRAILRQKTLLGETYVELSPGSHERAQARRRRERCRTGRSRRPCSSTRSSRRSTRPPGRRSRRGCSSRAPR